MRTSGTIRVRAIALLATGAALLGGCTPAAGQGASPFDDPFAAQSARVDTGESGQSGAAEAALSLPRGSGQVRVAHPLGHPLPASFVSAFEDASGYTLVPVAVASAADARGRADVMVGMDDADTLAAAADGALPGTAPQDVTPVKDTELAGAPAALAYGRDDVCAVADLSWFSANGAAMPTNLDELAQSDRAGLLAVPDPEHFAEGRAFAQYLAKVKGEEAAAFVADLGAKGVRIVQGDADRALDAWTGGAYVRTRDTHWALAAGDGGEGAQSAQSGSRTHPVVEDPSIPAEGSRPIIVGTQSLLVRAGDASGAQTTAAVIGGTCLARTLRASLLEGASNTAGATSFLTALTQDAGQALIGRTGWAAPLAQVDAESPAGWFLAPTADAAGLEAGENDPKTVAGLIEAWKALPRS
ncbi:hypothetical protein I6B53_09755 [Schaalia sp. 19OD2882]|uniref:hypothetical protein n=1 Tax=Schaalia sp. 19OD2882 TaxID=2794089 RepID=UPI001C1E9252|nr:hypothetical protein [Schaalia sp. 19OD2882]QWW19363.1 hypothetical protein I6B53_09755 [Schaalia sp. 19OD2882]